MKTLTRKNLPEYALNHRMQQQPIQWPKGAPIVNQGAVWLFRQSGNKFAVVYGLEVTIGLCVNRAAECYGHAIIHQAACDGLI